MDYSPIQDLFLKESFSLFLNRIFLVVPYAHCFLSCPLWTWRPNFVLCPHLSLPILEEEKGSFNFSCSLFFCYVSPDRICLSHIRVKSNGNLLWVSYPFSIVFLHRHLFSILLLQRHSGGAIDKKKKWGSYHRGGSNLLSKIVGVCLVVTGVCCKSTFSSILSCIGWSLESLLCSLLVIQAPPRTCLIHCYLYILTTWKIPLKYLIYT